MQQSGSGLLKCVRQTPSSRSSERLTAARILSNNNNNNNNNNNKGGEQQCARTTIGGLKPLTNYLVRARARVDGGWGPYSLTDTCRTTETPKPGKVLLKVGTHEWRVPDGVDRISAIVIGGGGGGGSFTDSTIAESGGDSRLGDMCVAGGGKAGEGGSEWRVYAGGAGGQGNHRNGGAGGEGRVSTGDDNDHHGGGGACGGQPGVSAPYKSGLAAGGSTDLPYAGHGGNGQGSLRLAIQGPRPSQWPVC